MRLTHFFIDRPIFATVLSVFVTLVGLGALAILPVAQYPEIVPPTVQITTVYPGASAETVARTVATPLEQQINGVESMLYMSSQSTGDGKLTITVTFRIGTDLNVAQMLTQNRVQNALSRLPEDVQRLGVQVRKATPNILLAVHLYSPDSSRDTLYMSNYATLHVKDALARLPGVGDVQLKGAREYAMRIWLDPDKVAARNLNASEVLAALRAQNLQVSAGILNQPPAPRTRPTRSTSQTLGRLSTPEQFADIVVKSDDQGRVTRVRDIGRVEIGAADYGSTSYMDRGPGRAAADLRATGGKLAGGRGRGPFDHRDAGEGLPAGPGLQGHLRPDDLHRQIGRPGHPHDLRGDPARRPRGVRLPAELARLAHPGDRDPGVADRHLRHSRGARDLLEQSVPVRPGAGGGYRGRRCDRRRREYRAQPRTRNVAVGGRAQDDGRGRRGADRDRADLVRGVRAVRLPVGHLGRVLPPVRDHHRGLDDHLLLRLADAEPGALRGAFKAHDPHHVAQPDLVRRILQAGFDRFNRGFDRLSNGYGC